MTWGFTLRWLSKLNEVTPSLWPKHGRPVAKDQDGCSLRYLLLDDVDVSVLCFHTLNLCLLLLLLGDVRHLFLRQSRKNQRKKGLKPATVQFFRKVNSGLEHESSTAMVTFYRGGHQSSSSPPTQEDHLPQDGEKQTSVTRSITPASAAKSRSRREKHDTDAL